MSWRDIWNRLTGKPQTKAAPSKPDWRVEQARRVAQQVADWRQYFPFEVVETTGRQALARWTELKSAGRGVPVVLGGDEAFSHVLERFHPDWSAEFEPATPARPVVFPGDLVEERNREAVQAVNILEGQLRENPDLQFPDFVVVDETGGRRTLNREQTLAIMNAENRHEPDAGEWPEIPRGHVFPELSLAQDILKNTPLDKIYIALVPTDDWTTLPVHLRFGGWNENPDANYHVAAFRHWRGRYGIELVGMGFDTLNLRAAHRPQTRDEAMALAREQYVYCADIIDQGVETYSALAATLMASDWWYFWWD